MATRNYPDRTTPESPEQTNMSSVYSKLKKVMEALDLSFIDQFVKKRRRKVGRKGIKPSSLMKAFLAKRILGIPSGRQLSKKLETSPTLRAICRLRKAPHHSTLSKARKRLALRHSIFSSVSWWSRQRHWGWQKEK